jgi:hypothetical protein
VDGLFVSPDTAFNRAHLRSRENQRRQRPLRAQDVLLVPVRPAELFSGLPGGEEARVLMQLDRVRADLPGDLGMAERYARLGAGVRGALHTIHTPLFGPAPALDTVAEVRRLAQPRMSSLDVLRPLQTRRAERLDDLARRDKLLRFPFRFGALAEALVLGRGEEAGEEALWPVEELRAGMHALHARHRERLEARGVALLEEGLGDAAALDRLDLEGPRFKREARADLERWATEVRARAPGPASAASGAVPPEGTGGRTGPGEAV